MQIKKKGFTLTELIIVIIMIGVLAAVLIPTLTRYINKAKFSNDNLVISELNKLLAIDKVDNNIDYQNITQVDGFLNRNEITADMLKMSTANLGYDVWFNYQTDQFELASFETNDQGELVVKSLKASSSPTSHYLEDQLVDDLGLVSLNGSKLANLVSEYRNGNKSAEINQVIPTSVIDNDNNLYQAEDGTLVFYSEEDKASNVVFKRMINELNSDIFNGCFTPIDNISVPSSIEVIRAYTFMVVGSVQKIIIPSEVKTFETNAFLSVGSGTPEVSYGETVVEVENGNLKGYNHITPDKEVDDTVQSITLDFSNNTKTGYTGQDQLLRIGQVIDSGANVGYSDSSKEINYNDLHFVITATSGKIESVKIEDGKFIFKSKSRINVKIHAIHKSNPSVYSDSHDLEIGLMLFDDNEKLDQIEIIEKSSQPLIPDNIDLINSEIKDRDIFNFTFRNCFPNGIIADSQKLPIKGCETVNFPSKTQVKFKLGVKKKPTTALGEFIDELEENTAYYDYSTTKYLVTNTYLHENIVNFGMHVEVSFSYDYYEELKISHAQKFKYEPLLIEKDTLELYLDLSKYKDKTFENLNFSGVPTSSSISITEYTKKIFSNAKYSNFVKTWFTTTQYGKLLKKNSFNGKDYWEEISNSYTILNGVLEPGEYRIIANFIDKIYNTDNAFFKIDSGNSDWYPEYTILNSENQLETVVYNTAPAFEKNFTIFPKNFSNDEFWHDSLSDKFTFTQIEDIYQEEYNLGDYFELIIKDSNFTYTYDESIIKNSIDLTDEELINKIVLDKPIDMRGLETYKVTIKFKIEEKYNNSIVGTWYVEKDIVIISENRVVSGYTSIDGNYKIGTIGKVYLDKLFSSENMIENNNIKEYDVYLYNQSTGEKGEELGNHDGFSIEGRNYQTGDKIVIYIEAIDDIVSKKGIVMTLEVVNDATNLSRNTEKNANHTFEKTSILWDDFLVSSTSGTLARYIKLADNAVVYGNGFKIGFAKTSNGDNIKVNLGNNDYALTLGKDARIEAAVIDLQSNINYTASTSGGDLKAVLNMNSGSTLYGCQVYLEYRGIQMYNEKDRIISIINCMLIGGTNSAYLVYLNDNQLNKTDDEVDAEADDEADITNKCQFYFENVTLLKGNATKTLLGIIADGAKGDGEVTLKNIKSHLWYDINTLNFDGVIGSSLVNMVKNVLGSYATDLNGKKMVNSLIGVVTTSNNYINVDTDLIVIQSSVYGNSLVGATYQNNLTNYYNTSSGEVGVIRDFIFQYS